MEIVFNIFYPSVSFALTAGPTAPEATSFEPIDTTDTVDLKTGDFTYNVPVLEVPGPAGGYPLALSYHAGIQPDQEASWTGLGFTLNPGSIFRLVNGYPDDHDAVNNVVRSYWVGGESTSSSIGISFGIANVASVSADLTFAHDTYKGCGVGVNVQVGFGVGNGFKVGVSGGISPYGDGYASMGVNVGIGGANIGLSMGTEGAGAFASIAGEDGITPAAGASISSNGAKPSLSGGGFSGGVYNGRFNHVSTQSNNFNVEIPIYIGISLRLGRSYQRYWIDEKVNAFTYGALYMADASPSVTTAFDTYDLLDTRLDIARHDDPEKVLGGSFPDVDLYSVSAQGVSGNIQPYHYRQHLYRQDKNGEDDNFLTKSYPLSTLPPRKAVEFRFVNDFSNRVEYEPGSFNVTTDQISFDFAGNLITGENGNDGYNENKNQLAGSKHIEWYTNAEIRRANPDVNPFAEGFRDAVAQGFVRDNNSQVGGYSITNSSGVTYHYSLPAYSFDEYMKSVNVPSKQEEDGVRWNEVKKPQKYAYTWYLTAVTGPDYVDRNDNGFADVNDWGYWVNFEYSQWLNNYQWRNPGEGGNSDLDGEFENFSAGRKEIYYLDKIRTQTHVAVFEKSARIDGREVSDLVKGGFAPKPIYETNCSIGCFNSCKITACPTPEYECDQGLINACTKTCTEACPIVGYSFPRPSLKLDRIKLFNREDFVAGRLTDEFVLRGVNFTYGYDLAPKTPNSYAEENFNPQQGTVTQGKLTLKSLAFLGKKMTSIVPPTTFEYKNAPYQKGYTDVWGFYKNDFSEDYKTATNNIISRLTTDASAVDVDAWSLNQITTSLGAIIKINYESDRYDNVVLNQQQIFRVKSVVDEPPGKIRITFWETFNLADYFDLNDYLGIDLMGAYSPNGYSDFDCPSCLKKNGVVIGGIPGGYRTRAFSGTVKIDEVDLVGKSLLVSDVAYYNLLKVEPKVFTGHMTNTATQELATYTLTFKNAQALPDYFPAGVVSAVQKPKPGGGIRVKSIELTKELSKEEKITSYEYAGGTTSYEPYEILAPKIDPDYPGLEEYSTRELIVDYKRAVLNKASKQISLSRQLPGPGVMYKLVTVKETNKGVDGIAQTVPVYVKYEFETYEKGMVDVVYGQVTKEQVNGSYNNVSFKSAYLSQVTLKDYSSRIGNLKSITRYNTADNTPIAKTKNNYLHDDLDGSFAQNSTTYENNLNSQFTNQGVVEETFTRSRILSHKASDYRPYLIGDDELHYKTVLLDGYYRVERDMLASINKKETYPSIATGQTDINYKTGMETTSQTLGFDFYSGHQTKVLSQDSYGNSFLSVSVPAYRHYNQMGLKTADLSNKNMLEQQTEQYTYVVDNLKQPAGLLSASVQTWSNAVPVLNVTGGQPAVWRVQSSYAWNGEENLNTDGSYSISDFNSHPFSRTAGATNLKWEKNAEVTLNDVYSHALEAKDVNGNYLSTRLNKDQTKVTASAVNAKYSEMVFSGAEYYAGNTEKDGDVARGDGSPSPAHPHTGKYSLLVGVSKSGFNYTLPGSAENTTKKYRASVWVYAPGEAETQSDLDKIELFYTINGSTVASIHPVIQKNKSKSWYLLNIDIVPNGSNSILVGVRNGTQRGIYFDDFRIHPLNASMTSFVYDPLSGELTHILDANNFYTKFEYDAMGRLVRSSKELLNFDFGAGNESYRADLILKEVRYNYAKSN